MSRVRELSKNNRYWISKHRFIELKHHCLQYREWKDERDSIDGRKAVNYDSMPHGSSVGSSVENDAIKRAGLSAKMSIIEEAAHDADPMLAKWILKGVTEEGITYTYLQMKMGIPCTPGMYYERRRRFYWLLDKKLENQ